MTKQTIAPIAAPTAFAAIAEGCGACFRKTLDRAAAVAARKTAMRPISGTSSRSSPRKMTATPTIARAAAPIFRGARRSTPRPAAIKAVESRTVAAHTGGTASLPMRIARKVLPQITQQARKTRYATVGRYDAPRSRERREVLDARQDRDLRRDREVELHEDDEGDAEQRTHEAQQRAKCVEGLPDEDPALHRGRHSRRRLVCGEALAHRVDPVQIEQKADRENVRPVRQQCEAVRDEFREQGRREWHERDRREERELEPREVPVGAGEQVQLGLLAVPEDPEREEAQE